MFKVNYLGKAKLRNNSRIYIHTYIHLSIHTEDSETCRKQSTYYLPTTRPTHPPIHPPWSFSDLDSEADHNQPISRHPRGGGGESDLVPWPVPTPRLRQHVPGHPGIGKSIKSQSSFSHNSCLNRLVSFLLFLFLVEEEVAQEEEKWIRYSSSLDQFIRQLNYSRTAQHVGVHRLSTFI